MSLLMVRKSAPARAADKNENIAQDSEIVALWQVLGDAQAYLREGKKSHNVKNVLAAAIKAAEKEDPNDRSVAEAKNVLAQFDAAADASEVQRVEKLLKRELTDAEFWKLGDYVMKNFKAGRTFTDAELLKAVKDCAADAAQFKVGDLVRMSEGGLTGKITKIEPNGHFRVSFLYNRANGFSQSFSADEIVMVKPAKDAADSASGQDDDASDVKFAKEQLAVFQGIRTSVVRFRMTTPNGTKFAKAYRLTKEILDSVYEIETELKHFV